MAETGTDARVEHCLREYATLKTQRLSWEPTWQAIADTMVPAANDIVSVRTPGTQRTQRLYDGTALQAGQLLTGHINAGVTNFATRWFGLRMAEQKVTWSLETKEWLDACSQIMLEHLNASMAPNAVHEMLLSYVYFGTGGLFVDEQPMLDAPRRGFRGLQTRSQPISSYCIAENAIGLVDTAYRELELSPRQAEQWFGYEALHDTVKAQLEQGESRHVPAPYLHAVYPRRRYGASRLPADWRYSACYIDVQHRSCVQESGYQWFPYLYPRWSKLKTWSPWGFGPGHLALPDTLTLNAMDQDVLMQLARAINPPYWTDDDSAVGRVSLLPGAINPLTRGSQIAPMLPAWQPDVIKLGMEERRQRIKNVFFIDQLMMLPPPTDPGHMTAYEVSQRVALMQRLMGAAFMRLLNEFLNPFLDIVFQILLQAGELPDIPEEVAQAAMQGMNRIEVNYEGPLARAQRGEELEGIQGTLLLAQQISAATGTLEIYDNLDLDDALRRTGAVLGAPPTLLRDKKMVDALRAQRQQSQAQQAQLQQMGQMAEAAGKAAPALSALQEFGGTGTPAEA
jgi:hypothetical protein